MLAYSLKKLGKGGKVARMRIGLRNLRIIGHRISITAYTDKHLPHNIQHIRFVHAEIDSRDAGVTFKQNFDDRINRAQAELLG